VIGVLCRCARCATVQAQDAKVKGMSSELSRLEDRVRSESAQQAELQVSRAGLPGSLAQIVCNSGIMNKLLQAAKSKYKLFALAQRASSSFVSLCSEFALDLPATGWAV
jgi:hypothetical protein